MRDFPFLAAGIDEQQILLPVVEEAEILLRIAGLAWRRRPAGCRNGHCGAGRRRMQMNGGRRRLSRKLRHRHRDARRAGDDGRPFALRRMRLHEAVDAIERVGGDAAAIAQPRCELAVIHRAAAESGFGEPGLPAIIGDFLEELLRIHGVTPLPRLVSSTGARATLLLSADASAQPI